MNPDKKPVQDPGPDGLPDDEDVVMEYNPKPENDRGIVAVKNKHEADIMSIPGVNGIGVTQNAIGDDAIAVYVREKAAANRVPRSIDGYDVEIIVVGEIDAQ